jgi:hypothetical protein
VHLAPDADARSSDATSPSPAVPANDHGRDSIAHLGVALLASPPPPLVFAPAGTPAAVTPLTPRTPPAPSLSAPPSRGPPDVIRLSLSAS